MDSQPSKDTTDENDVGGYRPELPDWGCYPRWPEPGEAWIYPEDLELARQLIPSRRVFLRSKWDGEFYWLCYGQATLRVQPTLWVRAPSSDLLVGQQVELLSQHGENDAGLYFVHEIFLAPDGGACEYWLRQRDFPIAKSFPRQALRPLKERHHLKVDYFKHSVPTSKFPKDIEKLDVGEVTGETSRAASKRD